MEYKQTEIQIDKKLKIYSYKNTKLKNRFKIINVNLLKRN